jgi:hypothetical protein
MPGSIGINAMNTSQSQAEKLTKMPISRVEPLSAEPAAEKGFFSSELFECLNSTPLGRLLGMIGSLPEIRQEKVTNIREKIDHGQYDLNENLDAALDMVLEEFIADG